MTTTVRKTLYLPYRPANGPKFLVKRDAETVARFLAENGYEVEWVKRNWGGQGTTSWNVRLADGSEIHSRNQLEDMGFRVRYGSTDAASRKKFHGPPDYGVRILYVREGWTVNIAWTERGKPASIGCGHGHKSHDAAWRCAEVWRRRIKGDAE
jgi:hypothetical protein